jgi:hypothetical protein
MISERNTLHFCHGGTFSTAPGSEPGQFQLFTYPVSLPLDALKENNASVLLNLTAELAEKVAESQMKRLYEVAGEGAERVGNALAPTPDRPLAETFIEMAERVDYSVGEDGQVHFPSFHLHPNTAERILPELKAQEAQYAEKMEELHQRKIAEALARERERLAKFRSE